MNYNSPKNAQYINSICRAIDIIELFSKENKEFLGLLEISRLLNLQKTTTFRILKTLEHCGWIEQKVPNGKYNLRFNILIASASIMLNYEVKDIIFREMTALRDTYNENVLLSTLIDDIGICLDLVKSKHKLTMTTREGYQIPLHLGATGKTLLAYQPQNYIYQYIDKYNNKVNQTIDKDKLLEDLNKILKDGYATTTGEVDLDVTAIVVPLFGSNNKFLYSLTVSAPQFRLLKIGQERIVKSLLDTSLLINKHMEVLGI